MPISWETDEPEMIGRKQRLSLPETHEPARFRSRQKPYLPEIDKRERFGKK
jgi:hypothetical protein